MNRLSEIPMQFLWCRPAMPPIYFDGECAVFADEYSRQNGQIGYGVSVATKSRATNILFCALTPEAALDGGLKALEQEKAERLEFENRFWEERLATPGGVIIGGCMYFPGRRPKGSLGAGMGGRRFDIEFLTGGRVTTYDLWHSGEIPERFRDRAPDNARFLGGARRVALGGETGGFEHAFAGSPERDEDYKDWHLLPKLVADTAPEVAREVSL